MPALRASRLVSSFLACAGLAAACALPSYEVTGSSSGSGGGHGPASSGAGASSTSGKPASAASTGGATTSTASSAATGGAATSSTASAGGSVTSSTVSSTVASSGGVACSDPSTCPPTGSPCLVATCTGGMCGVQNQPDGTACGAQVCCSGACSDVTADKNNCGGCGNACTIAAPSTVVCAAGRCLATLATGSSPWGVAVDASNVYWTDRGTGTVSQVSAGGGTPTVLATGQPSPQGVAVNGSSVYWVNNGTTAGTVMKAAIGGVSPPAQLWASGASAVDIAVDATNVYWTAGGTCPTQNGVWQCSSTLCLSPLQITNCSATVTRTGIAIDATMIYWAGTTNKDIGKNKIGGGALGTTGSGTAPWGLALDATNLYWTDGSGTIFALPKGGGTASKLATGQGNPQGIAVDATNAYWVNNAGGPSGVMSVPVGGGTAVTLAAATAPISIAVDGTSVYFTDTGAVMKLWPK